MRNVALGGLFGAGLVIAICAWWCSIEPAQAAPRTDQNQAQGEELITVSTVVDEHREQLTLIDARQRVISVYHVARDTGEISLKSVRKIHWDLQMEEFNSASPRPREVRVALEQQ